MKEPENVSRTESQDSGGKKQESSAGADASADKKQEVVSQGGIKKSLSSARPSNISRKKIEAVLKGVPKARTENLEPSAGADREMNFHILTLRLTWEARTKKQGV